MAHPSQQLGHHFSCKWAKNADSRTVWSLIFPVASLRSCSSAADSAANEFLGSTTILVVLSLLCGGKHPFRCFFWDTGRLDPSPCKKNTAVTLGDGPVVEQHFSPMIVMARNWGYSTPIPYLLLIPFGFLVIYNLSILPFWFLLTPFSFSFGWLQHVP